ncbi:NAD(P)/FAD-dependent oxidoreductase [Cereibacter sp. SYSU M97828]|nr:NAD(P)/FAD-dependent oxidoreductase [Cereibacter flavus]
MKHVVVVGGGFGGYQAVSDLKGAGVRITLIDQRNHHLFQPLLYQVASTILSSAEVAWPLRLMLRGREDVTVMMAKVEGVDTAAREVLVEDGQRIGYDYLILATGAQHSYFGNDQWAGFAPGLKTVDDAIALRRKILTSLELAEKETDEARRAQLLTFAVIGGGPTGVELSGIIADLTKRTIWRDFRNIDTRKARVLLIEGAKRVLGAFPEDLSEYTRGALERRGVEVMLGRNVSDIGAGFVKVGDEEIPCGTVVWAAGVAASPAAKWLGVEADRAGRIKLGRDLLVPGYDDIFAVGDTVAVEWTDGKTVPGIAPAAKQMGSHVAKTIYARVVGKPDPAPFTYRHQGDLATIGRFAAVVKMGRVKMKGWLAWWVWGIAHIFFLIDTQSRIVVAWNWLWTLMSGRHAARIITRTGGDPRA